MNYADIIRINYPNYVVTHAGDGTNYDALEWSIYNPSPNPIPKATLDAEIAGAVGINAGELADLTTSGEQELYALSNLDESTGLVKKLGHASYVLDKSAYITGITSNNVITALGYTPYDAANPQVYTTKSYVDSLVSVGIVWVNPIHAFNFIGTASAPPSGTPHENENYIIMAGGNTGVWSSFQPGDRISYVGGTWVWRELAHVGCRLGVNFDNTAGALSGDAVGKQNYIGEITGGNFTDGYTWTWTAPANHMSTFNNLSTSTKFGQAYTYDGNAGNWIPFATNTVLGGNAITINGQTVNVDYGPGTAIYNDTIAVLPFSGGGLMNTLDGSTSSDNKEAALSLTHVGTVGTYKSVTTDVHGRVTAGSNPTTLAGFGITDAVASSQLGAALGVATLDSGSKLTSSQLPTHNQDWSTITNTPTSVTGYGITDAVSTSLLGANSGIATLDSSGKLTTAQIPTSLVGGLNYQGTWNASTNTPTLANGTGTKGYYYKVSVAGATNINGFASWTVGDMIVYNGASWDAVQGGASDVTSVFGRVGAVTATLASADFANQGTSTTLLRGNAAGNPVWSSVSLSTMVSGTLAMTSTGALTGDVTKTSGGSILTLATVNTNTGTFGSTAAVPVITVNGKGLITAVTTATIPAAITLTGDVTATGTVGGSTATTLTSTAVVAGTYGSATQVPQFDVDAKGRLTSAGNIAIPNTVGITGDGTASITTGSSGALTLATVNTNVGTFGSSVHVPQVTVNGKGLVTAVSEISIPNTIDLTGDGTASVTTGSSGALTLSTVNATTGAFGDTTHVPQFTVNAKGLVTAVSNVAIQNSIAFSGDATGSGTVGSTTALTLANSGVASGVYGSAGSVAQLTVDTKGRVTTASNVAITPAAIGAVATSAVGAANGIATLGADGKLTTAQIPSSLVGSLVYQGTWNASTNNPILVAGTGTKGQYYTVSVAGTTSIDGHNNWTPGDWIIFDGTVWEQIQGGSSDVVSVFGRTGAVTATLASADFANQGTTTTVLHGNAAGNPTWGAINLATDVTGILPETSTGALTGDITKASGASTTTLTNSGVAAGVYGATGSVAQVTVDSKGRVTTAANVAITPAAIGAINTNQLGVASGVATLSAGGTLVSSQLPAHNQAWSTITSTPTTMAGYGITDGLSISYLATANVSMRHILLGDSITHPNVANVYVSGVGTGPTADRPMTFIDTSGVMKIVRVGGNPAVELHEWDAGITARAGYFDVVSVNGQLQIRDRNNDISTVILATFDKVTANVGLPGNVAVTGTISGSTISSTSVTASAVTGLVSTGLTATSAVPLAYLQANYSTLLNNNTTRLAATGTVAATTATGVIPFDNTVPLNTEGTQLWSVTVTPASSNSRFIIDQSFMVDSATSNRNIQFALFRNGTCIYATTTNVNTSGRPQSITIHDYDVPATASAVTYMLRAGINSSGTWYVNQSTTAVYSTAATSAYTIMEIL